MERLVEVEKLSFETREETILRPNEWNNYIGQEKIKNNLRVFIDAAKKREDVLDHVLFYGPPGLGKTTLAYLISTEMNANIKVTAGPMIEKSGDGSGGPRYPFYRRDPPPLPPDRRGPLFGHGGFPP